MAHLKTQARRGERLQPLDDSACVRVCVCASEGPDDAVCLIIRELSVCVIMRELSVCVTISFCGFAGFASLQHVIPINP